MEPEEAYQLKAGLPQDLGARAYTPGYATRDPQEVVREGPPLTAITMAYVNSTNDQLREIVGRLQEMRDRIFGPQPMPGSALNEKAAPPSGFTDHFARSAQETNALLSSAARLTIELSNRL